MKMFHNFRNFFCKQILIQINGELIVPLEIIWTQGLQLFFEGGILFLFVLMLNF